MLEHGMIAPSQEVIQVAGSGVDPVYFRARAITGRTARISSHRTPDERQGIV